MGIARGLVQLVLLWGVAGLGMAYADSGDCSGNGPLVVGYAESWEPVQAPSFLGEWRLPVSSQAPDLMTEARVRVDLLRPANGKGALLSVNFSFPDPNPLGLPFTFERAELSWQSDGTAHSAQLDWSQNCNNPGRSLYPHQSWTALIEISSDSQNLIFESPVFRIWGSRN